jgi:hypothetical protein
MSELLAAIWSALTHIPNSISFLAAAAWVVATCWVAAEEAIIRGRDRAGTDGGE